MNTLSFQATTTIAQNGTRTRTGHAAESLTDHAWPVTAEHLVPIAIGITGHRDLRPQDIPQLEATLRGVLRELRQRYPSTPITVVSALAEGADRLAARIALQEGARLVAPLPMRRELYETDFPTEASRTEFAEFLARAWSWFELPLLPGATEDEISIYGPARDRQYAYVGAYLARNSQMLIAMWDGVPLELVGGTAFIAEFQLKGIPPTYIPRHSIFEPEETGPVYHIITPRIRNQQPPENPCTLRKLYPERFGSQANGERAFQEMLARIERLNRAIIQQTPPGLPQFANQLRDPAHHEVLQTLQRCTLIDQVATAEQARASRKTVALSAATLLMIVTMNALALMPFSLSSIFVSYLLPLLLLLTAGGWTAYLLRGTSPYFDYRALAEGLRVRTFWLLSGINEPVAEHYLGKQRSELDWVRQSLRAVTLPMMQGSRCYLSPSFPANSTDWSIVEKEWIAVQERYYTAAAKREEVLARRARGVAVLVLLSGVLVTLLQLAWGQPLNYAPIAVIVYAEWLLPLVVGLLLMLVIRTTMQDYGRRYQRMATLFQQGDRILRDLLSGQEYESARQMVTALGKEALNENGEWLLRHRTRPIIVPHRE